MLKRSFHFFEPGLSLREVSLESRVGTKEEFSFRSIFFRKPFAILVLALFFAATAAAQTLTGVVKNATTGKPSAGDEVVLLKLGQGMEEAGRTRTDRGGNFSFKVEDAQTPHLVRAIHQEVTYHRMAPPGTTSVEVQVYDVAKKIEGVEVVADIMHIQATGGQMEITREFGVQNSSKPPRTQSNEHNLEFYVPEGAKILEDSGSATTENGNPLKSAPAPDGEKNRYAFDFPLRPGLTQFEVTYQLPYSGSANLDPKSAYPLRHFVVMLPKTMQFSAASPDFKLVKYPSEPNDNVRVASDTATGADLSFKISGEGTLQPPQETNTADNANQGDDTAAAGEASQSENRPGGGLGVPIDAPDPLQKYRWWILGTFAGVLIVGGVYIASRQQAEQSALNRQRAGMPMPENGQRPESGQRPENDQKIDQIGESPASRPPVRRSSMLMEGLKEELFRLEIDRKQGQISPADYDKSKAVLDQMIEIALAREAKRA